MDFKIIKVKKTKDELREEHIQRHKELHKMLDELSADFIRHTDKLPSDVMELMTWSFEQTKNPSEELE